MDTVYLVLGWIATNALALGGGAVVGYLFGPKAVAFLKALVAKLPS